MNNEGANTHYHASCYKAYTRPRPPPATQISLTDQIYSKTEEDGFKYLCSFIHSDLLLEPRVIAVQDLRDIMIKWMRNAGVSKIRDSTKKHLRRKLEAEFMHDLLICSTTNRTVLVVPKKLSVSILEEEIYKLQQKVKQLESASLSKASAITKAALHVRDDIKEQTPLQWFPNPEVLDKTNVNLPPSVVLFFTDTANRSNFPPNKCDLQS